MTNPLTPGGPATAVKAPLQLPGAGPAPPGAPPDGPPFQSALDDHMARTATAEGHRQSPEGGHRAGTHHSEDAATAQADAEAAVMGPATSVAIVTPAGTTATTSQAGRTFPGATTTAQPKPDRTSAAVTSAQTGASVSGVTAADLQTGSSTPSLLVADAQSGSGVPDLTAADAQSGPSLPGVGPRNMPAAGSTAAAPLAASATDTRPGAGPHDSTSATGQPGADLGARLLEPTATTTPTADLSSGPATSSATAPALTATSTTGLTGAPAATAAAADTVPAIDAAVLAEGGTAITASTAAPGSPSAADTHATAAAATATVVETPAPAATTTAPGAPSAESTTASPATPSADPAIARPGSQGTDSTTVSLRATTQIQTLTAGFPGRTAAHETQPDSHAGISAAPVSAVAAAPNPDAPAALLPPSASTTGPAPSDAPVLSAPVNLQEAIEAVHATIELATRQGLAQARIALHPEELGEIRIHLTQSAQGIVARVTADTPAAAQALADGHAELRQSLGTLNLTALHLDTGASGQPGGGTQAREERPQHSGAAVRLDRPLPLAGEDHETVSLGTPLSQTPSPGALVDVLA